MHIIGKIIEENYKLLIMIQYHANFGSLKIIFLNMDKVVKINWNVKNVMDGKNMNIIISFTK